MMLGAHDETPFEQLGSRALRAYLETQLTPGRATPMAKTILIVDDDPHIQDVISFALEREGYTLTNARDGAEALRQFKSANPDLIVLDVSMPEMDGLEVCREIRKSSDVPILFLSSKDEEIDRILGLEMGGDDYVTKPFSPRELVARIKVILKRAGAPVAEPEPAVTLEFGAVKMWTDQHRVQFGATKIDLTATEFQIVRAFLSRPQIVQDRNTVMDKAYADNIHVSDRTVDSHIRHIRTKFAAAGCASIIETVHGVGYKLGTCS